jgi:hypothetical protein
MTARLLSYCSSCLGQYFIALVLMAAVLGCLYVLPQGKISLTLPDGDNQVGHPWQGSDVMTYVDPARSLLETGVFARGGVPDLHRTVGYPAFLALMMWAFGDMWLPMAYIFQLFIFASLFPAVTLVIQSWFPEREKLPPIVFGILLLNGAALAYAGLLLTDLFFSALLMAGIAAGLLAVRRVSWLMAVFHIGIIACAAQVRPTLGLFAVVNVCFMVYTARKWQLLHLPKIKLIIAVAALLLLIAGNGPAIRNYFNHGIFTPTTVLSNGLARYLTGPILIEAGQKDIYERNLQDFRSLSGVELIEMQKKFAMETVAAHPFLVFKRVVYHAFWNLFEPHWEYILNVFDGGFFLNEVLDENGQLNKKMVWAVGFWLGYLLLYGFFLVFIIRALLQGEFVLLVGLAFFLMPFLASFMTGQGARMRLYAEPILLIFACAEFFRAGKEKFHPALLKTY